MLMTPCTGSVRGGFGGFEKSLLSFSIRRRRLALGARRGQASRLRRGLHMIGGRWKSQHRKIVHLSPHVEKPFNSKVIKSFVPEPRSRKCFFVFRDSYVIYMCVMDIMDVLRTGMNMSISCIHIWLCVSGFLCYLNMSYEHSTYISHIHVWLCYTRRKQANFLTHSQHGVLSF